MLILLLIIVPLLVLPSVLSFLPQLGNFRSIVGPPQSLSTPSSSSGFNITGIATFYADALSVASETLNASSLISSFPVQAIPAQYQAIVNSTNRLIENLTVELLTSENEYRVANFSEELGNYHNSSIELVKAESDVLAANLTYASILSSFDALSQSGVLTGSDQQGLSSLSERISSLFDEIYGETNLVENIENGTIAPTELTLGVNSSTVTVDQGLLASGSLDSKGSPVGNQIISLAYNGYGVGTTKTDSTGEFELSFSTLANYTSSANITARFDSPKAYAPALAIAYVNLSFYTPFINVTSIPQNVVPGQSYEIGGNIFMSPSGPDAFFPAPFQIIEADLFGNVTNITYDGFAPAQPFLLQFVANQSAPDGINTLIFNSSGNAYFAPLYFPVGVVVTRQTPSVALSYHTIVNPFEPFRVSGKIMYGSGGNETALSNGTVVLGIGGRYVEGSLNPDGTFSLAVRPNIATILEGGDFSLQVDPGPVSIDSYSSSYSVVGLLTNSDVSVILILSILFGIAVFYYEIFLRLIAKRKHLRKNHLSAKIKTAGDTNH
jgi:hypothetical protein